MGGPQTVKKASQSSRPQARKKSNPFSPAACTSEENTARKASVERPPQADAEARSAAHPLCRKTPQGGSTSSGPAKWRAIFASYVQTAREKPFAFGKNRDV